MTDHLGNSGWRNAESDTPSPFDLFTSKREFSLQNELLISIPARAIGLDFNDADVGTELGIRKLLMELFREHFPNAICLAIDVNHQQRSFVPAEVSMDQNCEPWPFNVTPWAEYATMGNPIFSHGVFCNPINNHMVVYGKPFEEAFAAGFPNLLVDAKAAAMSGSGLRRSC